MVGRLHALVDSGPVRCGTAHMLQQALRPPYNETIT